MNSNLNNLEMLELDLAIKLLWNLVTDLKAIRLGGGPSDTELANAPIMQNWFVARRLEPCLSGNFSGHPRLHDGDFGVTSQLWFIDPRLKYVRTLSRYYRLGIPMETEGVIQ